MRAVHTRVQPFVPESVCTHAPGIPSGSASVHVLSWHHNEGLYVGVYCSRYSQWQRECLLCMVNVSLHERSVGVGCCVCAVFAASSARAVFVISLLFYSRVRSGGRKVVQTLGTNSATSGNVPDSSSPRRPSQATTRHAAEKRPPLLRTLENAADTTPAETAKVNFGTTTPPTLYHTIDRRSLPLLFLYILTRFTISRRD